MTFSPNLTLSMLRAGTPAVGCWIQLCSPVATRLMAAQGYPDWKLVDFEHCPLDFGTAAAMLPTISEVSGRRITPLARVEVGSIDAIKRALDCGAQGIIAPMIGTAEQAADVVRFAKFPPLGVRGAGGLFPHLGHGVDRHSYLKQANEHTLVGIQIETKEGLDNLDAILDVPGIDLVFVGPNDLHMSLGLGAKFWSDEPAFVDAIEAITVGCRSRGIALGTLCPDAASAQRRIDDGFTFVGLGSDAHFMLTFGGMQFAELRGEDKPSVGFCNRVQMR